MTKKKILVVVSIAFLIGAFINTLAKETVMADNPRSGDYSYVIEEDGTIGIMFYDGKETNVEVPAELDGKTVTKIYGGAFYEKDCIESISIPATITWIGSGFTHDCSNLQNIFVDSANMVYASVDGNLYTKNMTEFVQCPSTKESINVPTSITTIGADCFAYCEKLQSIVLPDSVTKVKDKAFFKCSNLRSVTLSANQTKIEYSTFQGCSELREIVVPGKVWTIDRYAFGDCSNLTEIHIPASVTDISLEAFHNCNRLETIEVDRANTKFTIDDNVLYSKNLTTLYRCSVKKDSISIPKSVKFLASSAFQGCSNLTSIILPDSICNIPDYLFAGCSNLVKLDIPTGVTEIGYQAFTDCNRINKINIPAGVTNLRPESFIGCSNLLSIDVDSANENYASLDGVLYNKYKNTIIRCPQGKDSVTLPSDLLEIKEKAFDGCTRLQSISLPTAVEFIKYNAFRGCTSLKTINVPQNVKKIDMLAFEGCSNLQSINVDSKNETYTSIDGVVYCVTGKSREIWKLAFCPENKTSVKIPESVRVIGNYAFNGCSKLTSIVLPSDVIIIYTGAFYGCTGLKSIVLPSNLQEIGDVAFGKCGSLTSIIIQKGVTYIGYFVFEPCTVIRCYENSYAFQYAKENDLTYALLDVSGVKLNMTSKTIYVGEKLQLNATVAPTSALNKVCSYKSSNSKVAKVDAYGKVIGVTAGTATITVTTQEGAKTATCVVTVKPVTMKTLKLNVTSTTMESGAELQLKVATVTPTNTANKAVTYKSSDTKVAVVSTSGKVKAVGIGKCTITVTAKDGSKTTATCSITVVPKKVTGVKLNVTSKTISQGSMITIKATVTPTDAANKAVTYKSSDTKVAVVSTSGKVKAVGIGKCTITVTAKDGSKTTATCSITVVPKKVTSLKASKITKTSFTLSWKKVSGVTGYKIYKYDTKTKTYKYYKAVKGTSIGITKLKKNTSYQFIVKSYVKKGNKTYTSSQSDTKKVKTKY